MLVLTRKKGERVLIGDDIVITLIDVRGDGVRIGFDAPRGVPIQRAEVLTAVKAANAEAAAAANETGDLLVGFLSAARAAEAQAPQAAAETQAPAPAAAPQKAPAAPRKAPAATGPAKPTPPRPRA